MGHTEAQRTKSKGTIGLQLEVRAQSIPHICQGSFGGVRLDLCDAQSAKHICLLVHFRSFLDLLKYPQSSPSYLSEDLIGTFAIFTITSDKTILDTLDCFHVKCQIRL